MEVASMPRSRGKEGIPFLGFFPRVFPSGSGAAGLATTAGAAVLGTTFGVAGTRLAGYKMNKRVGAIEKLSVETLLDGLSLHCALIISGYTDEDTITSICRFIALGKADYIMGFAVSVAIRQTLMETVLAGRGALGGIASSQSHDKRLISLIGFSLGARVIYHCLLAMSKRSESAGIIEDVILLGAPVSTSPKQWDQMCIVVGGRVINGYCETDWLLRFLYRTMSVQFTTAGTGPVSNKNREIFNYNLGHIESFEFKGAFHDCSVTVKGHLDYSRKLSEILAAIGVSVSSFSPDSSGENFREAVGEAQDALTISVPDHNENETSLKDVDATANGMKEISIRDKENTN